MCARRRTCGHITRLPSGRYQLRIKLPDGRRVKISADSEAALREQRDTVLLDRQHRKLGLPGLLRRRPLLDNVMRDFLRAHEERVRAGTLAQGTIDHYYQCSDGWRIWIREEGLEALEAEALTDGHVQRYIAWRLGRKLTRKSSRLPSDVQVRKDLTQLRRVLLWAGIERRWSIPRTLRRNKGGKRIITPAQLFAFLDVMPEGSLERTLAEVGIATGMRPSDIDALELGSVDLESKLFRLVTRKDHKVMVIPFEDHLARHLGLWLERRRATMNHSKLFHLAGRPVDRHTVRGRFRKASKAAGIEPPLEFVGSLRNAFVAYLREDGASWDDLSDFLGHTNVRTTQDYARAYVSLKRRRAVAARGEAMRQRWVSPLGDQHHGAIGEG
jgi:integrase